MVPTIRTYLGRDLVRHIEARLPRTISDRIFTEAARPTVELARTLVRHIQARVPNEVSDQIFAELFNLNCPIYGIGKWRPLPAGQDLETVDSFLQPSIVGERLAQWCKDAFFERNKVKILFPWAWADDFLLNLRHGSVTTACMTYNRDKIVIPSHEGWENVVRDQKRFTLCEERNNMVNIVEDFERLQSLKVKISAIGWMEIYDEHESCVELRSIAPAIRQAQEKGVRVRVILEWCSYYYIGWSDWRNDRKKDVTAWFEPITEAEEAKAIEKLRDGFSSDTLWYKAFLREHYAVYQRFEAGMKNGS